MSSELYMRLLAFSSHHRLENSNATRNGSVSQSPGAGSRCLCLPGGFFSAALWGYFVLIWGFVGKTILSLCPSQDLDWWLRNPLIIWHTMTITAINWGPVTLITMIMLDFTIFQVTSLWKKDWVWNFRSSSATNWGSVFNLLFPFDLYT